MKSFIAFIKKEMTEQIRSGKLVFLAIIFVCIGIMNPAVAKLTPWMLEMLSDSLAQSGMTVTEVSITAMDSWVQFFKNIPIGLIAFILIESSIFTKEYSSGTLILSLTKGLGRPKVVISKAVILIALWSAGFWLCFGITYLYSSYFWDNSVAQNLIFSCVCQWLFGMLTVALTVLFSVMLSSNTGVLVGTGGVVLASYVLGLIPKLSKYLPTCLTNGNSLIYGIEQANEYVPAILITTAAIIICFIISVPVFNKKAL